MKIGTKPPAHHHQIPAEPFLARAARGLFPQPAVIYRPVFAAGNLQIPSASIVLAQAELPSGGGERPEPKPTAPLKQDLFTFYRENLPSANLINLKAAFELLEELSLDLEPKALGIELLMSWGTSPDTVAAYLLLDVDPPLVGKRGGRAVIDLIDRKHLLDEFDFQREFGNDQGGLYIKMLTAREQNMDVLLLKTAEIYTALSRNIGKRLEPCAPYGRHAFAPLLKVLRHSRHAQQLEDLAFFNMEPEKAAQTASTTYSGVYKLGPRYFAEEMRTLGECLIARFPQYTFNWREKGLVQIANKRRALHDLIALECIVEDTEQCYTALGELIKEMETWLFIYEPAEFDDYIAKPKETGYQALHATFAAKEGWEVEIQIKSKAMHHQATVGDYSHIRLKLTDQGFDSFILEAPNARAVYEANHFELNNKGYVYVYDENGRIIDVGPKRGSGAVTVLDFAFRLGIGVGSRVLSAVVRRLQSDGFWQDERANLDSPIKNGDMIILILAKDPQPANKARLKAANTQLSAASLDLIAAGVTGGARGKLSQFIDRGKIALEETVIKVWKKEAFSLFEALCPRVCGQTHQLHYSSARLYNKTGFRDAETFHAALGVGAEAGGKNTLLQRAGGILQDSSVVTGRDGDSIYVMFNNNHHGAFKRLLDFLEAAKLELKGINFLGSEQNYTLVQIKASPLEKEPIDFFAKRLNDLYKHTASADPFPARRQLVEIKFKIDQEMLSPMIAAIINLGERVVTLSTVSKFLRRGVEVRAVVFSPSISMEKMAAQLNRAGNSQVKKLNVNHWKG
ncbi:MAG: hypothetical protein WC632_01585 [Candidatus Margulisiibacteriota bacterium]